MARLSHGAGDHCHSGVAICVQCRSDPSTRICYVHAWHTFLTGHSVWHPTKHPRTSRLNLLPSEQKAARQYQPAWTSHILNTYCWAHLVYECALCAGELACIGRVRRSRRHTRHLLTQNFHPNHGRVDACSSHG